MKLQRHVLGIVGSAALALAATDASAQSVADFYKGKTVTIYIGYSPGGGYDAYARTIARHMGRHIPGNPSFTPKNRPGAGSLLLTNELYNRHPQDGTAISMIGRGMPMEALFGNKQARFDPTKINWIGSTNNEVSLCVTWHETGIDTLEKFRSQKITVGGTGPGADTDIFPKVLNNVVGTNLNLVTGYPGGNNINLAMEKGEVEGRCGWSWSSVKSTRPGWLKEGKVNLILQMSTSKHPELTKRGVPFVMDLAKTERDRKILTLVYARQAMGRPLATGPGVPEDRVAALRAAFDATMKDEKFLADIRKQKLELAPLSGKEIQELVVDIMTTPPEVVQAAKEASEKTGDMFIKKVKIQLVEHEGPVTQTKRGGRRIFIKYKDKEVRAKVSGSRTTVTIDGKNTERKNIKVGMTCKFTYPSAGSEAKRVDCKS
ncbi:MAG TPA: hypothetical protein VLN73_00370 [Alphaproteobacteria bacterium]|nr:hypothetical protein [Alphaproteobacteria bacterium]